MAILAAPLVKRSLHLRDLSIGQHRGEIRPLAAFLTSTEYPCGENFAVFYGQSLSIVEFLVDRKSPAEFVRFLRHAGKAGYDAALKDCYGLDGISDLERQWRQSAFAVWPADEPVLTDFANGIAADVALAAPGP
ncbi:MAG TPA: hypothetical protein VMV10_05430 [Pirellulales bacterium]|nr:hypothetical protein [Pirellulales bacterium]